MHTNNSTNNKRKRNLNGDNLGLVPYTEANFDHSVFIGDLKANKIVIHPKKLFISQLKALFGSINDRERKNFLNQIRVGIATLIIARHFLQLECIISVRARIDDILNDIFEQEH